MKTIDEREMQTTKKEKQKKAERSNIQRHIQNPVTNI